MADDPILQITSHIDGKNAQVRVYPDRVEWSRAAVSAAKVTAAVFTYGMSAAVTGGVHSKKRGSVEMIPIRSITSVTQHRDTVLNDKVSIITSGNTIDMRCARKEAEQLRAVILACINGHVTVANPHRVEVVQPAPVPAPTAPAPQGPPAGWYADKDDASLQRWWDGTRWTEHTQRETH